MDAATVQGWREGFEALAERVGPCFFRKDLRQRAMGYVRGLLGSADRKNGWQLAKQIGDASPHGIQRLLDRARWDADAVRDEVMRYASEHLLARGEATSGGGVLIVDETGFLKKGDKSVGPRNGAAAGLGHGGPELPGARTVRSGCSWRSWGHGAGR